jgi:hypothetical protein
MATRLKELRGHIRLGQRKQVTSLRCKFSGSASDGKLFEHIKKREKPPLQKAGTESNELPERVEEVETKR